jgi:glycosyltransferase involved in cell wall biosynthesis
MRQPDTKSSGSIPHAGDGYSKRELISVIMPCYNAAAFVEESIRCVINQTYPSVEIIVVDDGSTDGSVAILDLLKTEFPGQVRLLSQHRKGPYPARNRGLREARGSLIAFLDADDYWAPDCLEKLHAALALNAADCAYCGWQNVGDGAPGQEPYVPPAYEDEDTIALFLKSCPWPIHAALVRREIVEAIGGFSERRFSAMDYDFWLKLIARTRHIVRVPEVLAFYRWHGGGQISSGKWRQTMDAYAVRRDFVRKHPDLVSHLDAPALKNLVAGELLRAAYRAYWKRDLASAQGLFREALIRGVWRLADLKYILPALLPSPIFRALLGLVDSQRSALAPKGE